jgi:hypothetical protein
MGLSEMYFTLAFVATSRVALVPTFLIVTFAWAMMLPYASVTVPTIVPVVPTPKKERPAKKSLKERQSTPTQHNGASAWLCFGLA